MQLKRLQWSPSYGTRFWRSNYKAMMSQSFDRTLVSLTGWCGDISLQGSEVLIGRADICSARIALAHISSQHCKIVSQPTGELVVQDLSRNGTYVNGKKIGRERFQVLSNGDSLSLTPPGEQGVESVAFVFHDSKVCNTRQSVFAKGIADFNVRLVQLLGKGSFGEVYLGVNGTKQYAVKMVRKSRANPKLYEEVKVLDHLRHPHIVGIYQVWDSSNYLAMTLDLAEGGDLELLLKQTGPLSETDSKSLLVQVLNALAYLHEKKVIHRDLKPENILLRSTLASKAVPHLLLTDFGLSKHVDSHLNRARTICGTPFYAAPEIAQAEMAREVRTYDEKVDLWSTGIILYRFLNGKTPWDARRNLAKQIIAAACHRPKLDFHVSVSEECRRFFDKLVVEQDRRLSAASALKDEWFEEGRRKVAHSVLWDASQTQGLVLDEDSFIPDRFTVLTPMSTPDQKTSASPAKRARRDDEDDEVMSLKRMRSSGASTDRLSA